MHDGERGAPVVTVVIAAKNEAMYVRQAVESVLEQSLFLELVFVDDHSTDSTFEIVQNLADQDDRIRLVRNPGKGKVSAFNHGVELARGDWLCLFAGDDLMPEGALAARVDAVGARPPQDPILGLCRLVTMSENKQNDGHVVPRSQNRGAYSGACYLWNRAALDLMWPIPEVLPNEDTWLEVAAQHLDLQIVHSGVIGIKWRLHSGNSINYMLSYEDFNRRLTPRMAAASLFLEQRGDDLSVRSRRALEARVRCESARRRGDILRILASGVGPVDAARAIFLANPFLYRLRARLYGLLSGW